MKHMKRIAAFVLCLLTAIALLPAALAEQTDAPETALIESAQHAEDAETLTVDADAAAAPCGVSVPEAENGRRSDRVLKSTDGQPTSFALNDGFTAVLDDGVLTVTGTGSLRGYNKAADCPWYEYRNEITEVVFSDGITAIGTRLFYECENLASVQVPDGVTAIYNAFYGCTALKSVTLPASVTYLSGTFPDCSALESITAPGLETLGDYTFQGTKIKSYTLPKTLTEFSALAFYNGAVESFAVEDGNAVYTVKDGFLLTADGTKLVSCPAALPAVNVRIPDGVTTIGESAFITNANMKTLDFNGVTALEYSAFAYCRALETLVFPDTLTEIGSCVFESCENLKSVKFGSGLKTTGYRTFASCKKLASVDFGSSLEKIGGLCFGWCSGLKSIRLPETVTVAENGCFGECTSLESFISTSLTVFPYQILLNDVRLKELVINDGVTKICRYAVYGTQSLKEVDVPASVEFIDDYGFDPRYTTVRVGNPALDPFGRSGWRRQEYITVTGLYNYDKAFEMAELVNKEREAAGLNPLQIDAEMTAYAMQRSMELSVLYSHTRPDGSAFYSPYMGSLWAENAAEYQTSAADVMEAWINSEGHRENILTSYYTRIGVGCVEVEGRCYWIQWFSKYQTDPFEKPANTTVSTRIGYAVDVFGDAPQTSDVIFYFHRPPEYSYIIDTDRDEYAMEVGDTLPVRVTLQGYCISEKGEFWNAPLPYSADELRFSVDDPSVASVSGGVLTAKANGRTTLTVRTMNGHYTMQAAVQVGQPTPAPLPAFDGTVEWDSSDVQYNGTTPYVIANGRAQTPRFTVRTADGSVVDPAAYTAAYRENVNAGTAYVAISFTDVYSGTAQAWFKIYLPATTKTTAENREDGIFLTWDAVPGAAGYVVYRRAWSTATDGWTSFERWNNTTETTWTDAKVYAGTRYQYGVKAYFDRRVDPVSGAAIGGNVGDNYNLGKVGPLKTTVRITTRALQSVTAGKKQLTAKWSASKNFTGYEVQIATDAAFTKNVKTVKVTNPKTAETTVKSLKAKTTYYVRVRSYYLFEGMTYYGGWSNVKSAKTK